MRVYLNVSCLNRPFDDQRQSRIRLEADAVGMILERIDEGDWTHISSEMAIIKISANPDAHRRERVRLLLPESARIVMLTPEMFVRGATPEKLGFKASDAMHLAAAEHVGVDVLLSCDDRFCRSAQRHASSLRIPVRNPLEWLKEVEDAANLG